MENYHARLNSTIREAKIEVVGENDIKNEAQASVGISAINTFGDSSAGFIYFEPCTSRSTCRPPDVLICHPDTGLLVFEVKGFYINQIESIKAGNLYCRNNGFVKPVNPYRQVEDAMFDILNAVSRKLRNINGSPLINSLVALPHISKQDLKDNGFSNCLPGRNLLLKDEIDDLTRFKNKIMQLVKETLKKSNKTFPVSTKQVSAIQEAFGDSVVINDKRNSRTNVDTISLGAQIDERANRDNYLSKDQQELSRIELKGFPRLIRGVAGSGKTVVLANMAARYLNRKLNSDNLFQNGRTPPRIAAVCFNRALVSFIETKIRDSYHQQTHRDIPAGAVKVKHLNSLMYDLTREYRDDIKYVSTSVEASQRATQYLDALERFERKKPDLFRTLQFDAIFIDEGQDLVPEEYRLLLKLVKTDMQTNEKNLIIFYDDAQNLYGKPRPVWKDIGIDVQRGNRSRIMKECFRNTKEVVELGFNVMLGKQAHDSTAVTMRTYADVNMLRQHDLIEEYDDHFKVKFTKRSFSDPIVIQCSNRAEEKERVASEVINLIYDGQVRPEDILILFDRIAEYKDLDAIIKSKDKHGLIKGFIKPYGGNRDDMDRYIFQENHITLSTTKGAKGHDAYLVFLLGADLFSTDSEGRASFYVGATRSKLGLFITGVLAENNLLHEALKLGDMLK